MNGGYVCRTCTNPLRSHRWRRPALANLSRHRDHSTIHEQSLRVGIIGSGPAGFYAATRIIEKNEHAYVDMYEQLPAPFGLVRYGVAPDHPEVKNCQDRFEEIAKSPRFRFIGNVSVGSQIPLESLRPHYDALLFAYGASEDRTLGVPGEDLSGIISARAFVGWYNGLPEYSGINPDLQADNTAHIIGNGNVALDVARVLLSDLDRLRTTDISEEAVEALSRSRIERVHVYGRRGPMQAAFTIKEVRELLTLPGIAFEPIEESLLPSTEWVSKLPRLEQRKYRLSSLIGKGTSSSRDQAGRLWSLKSLVSPKEFKSDADGTHLTTMILNENEYDDHSDRFSPSARVHSMNKTVSQPAKLVFRSIGYKSTALPGLREHLGVPFNDKTGTIPNDMNGRVSAHGPGPTSLTGQVDGLYCAGWVKNGPTGVIASTMDDAFESADILLQDWRDGVRFMNGGTKTGPRSSGLGWEGVSQEPQVKSRGSLKPVSWTDWLKIDSAEKARGKAVGKPREKFRDIKDMLEVLD